MITDKTVQEDVDDRNNLEHEYITEPNLDKSNMKQYIP